jgi:hypothetical protein
MRNDFVGVHRAADGLVDLQEIDLRLTNATTAIPSPRSTWPETFRQFLLPSANC